LPSFAESTSYDGPEAKVCGKKYGTPTANQIVYWIRQPASQHCGADIRTGVDQAHQDLIVDSRAPDAKGFGEVEVGTIGAGLIPALNRCTDGASNDSHQQDPGYSPLMKDLITERVDLSLVQGFFANNVLIPSGILRNQSALPDNVAVVLEVFLAAEFVHFS
jgi:hypothetical protein